MPDVTFPILDASGWKTIEAESLGTKEKVWLTDDRKQEWLFKHPRPGTGEHWAEKVAAEVAGLLALPHAQVELASLHGKPGSVSLNFAPHRATGVLLHGNNLLAGVPGYEPAKKKPRLHSVDIVLRALGHRSFRPPAGCVGMPWVKTAADALVGYLMLDALVGNTDRHHENWGLLIRVHGGDGHLELAPTFDHASSLGRELDDEQRDRRLQQRDRRATVESYCERGPSPLYSMDDPPRPLTVRAAFARAGMILPQAATGWIRQLTSVHPARLAQVVTDLPSSVISPSGRRFAEAMLDFNGQWLLSSVPT